VRARNRAAMDAEPCIAYPGADMKILLRVGIVLVLLLVVLLACGLFFLDSLVKGGIEKGTTYATGTETKLESVDASLFSGRFGMKGLSIANPPGFRPEPFLHLGSAQATWDNGTILSDEIAIGTFALDGVEVDLESASGKTNYGAILANLEKLSGPADKKPAEPASSSAKKLSIKRIEIRNVKAGLHISGTPVGGGSLSVAVPLVAIDDFHSDGSTSEIVAKLTRALVEAVLQSALTAGKGVFPADILKDLGVNLKNLESNLQGQAKDALKGLNSDVKSIEDSLKVLGDPLKGKKK
jgi:hypothetical protein